MTRHVFDRSRPDVRTRAVNRFVELKRVERNGGLSRLLMRLDRARHDRREPRLPIYLRIARGVET